MNSVAIIIPIYNNGKSILNTFTSLQNQTFKNWKAIVIDDGSTDNSFEKISQIDCDKLIIIRLKQNLGRGYARQKGLEKVRELGFKYMCMLDADDWYFPNKLETQFNFMENNPDITLLSSAMAVVDKNFKIYGVIKTFEQFKIFNCIDYSKFVQLPHASSIIRVKDIEGINYNVNYRFSEDLDFLRRILYGKKYAFSPELFYSYNRDNSFSFRKYYKSILVDIDSFSNLPIPFSKKVKFKLFAWFKCLIVFILSTFGMENIYLRTAVLKPNNEEVNSFLELKKSVLKSG
ncbi:glycosyltransferase family 2 protein [Flavobacterium okayamense]|uniref:Glycosyltransferase 2-like domain-containing protein n=1 Tax=Flavobacterium okayamense TaxID=2830782 RepID=A0ABM7S085_9FLAO|nr:glycosyltransferase family 2 protein [Flavobacterium okayamense]BCY27267.1 hypothetical protein KK2020170_01350 [Flavobacterium okayamense]